MMITVKRIILLVVCIIFRIVSCEKTPTTSPRISHINQGKTPTKSPISTPTIKKSPLPTITFTSTATRKPNLPATVKVNTATATPTIPPEANLLIKCLDVAPDFSQELQSNGTLILEDDSLVISKMNMSTRETVQDAVPPGTLLTILVSPNRDLIAYYQILNNINDRVERNLLITDAENHIRKTIPWDKKWAELVAWLDDQHLVSLLFQDNPTENPTPKPFTLLALNPFTGEEQILCPDYPDILSTPPIPYWDGWGVTVYDPSLSRVVYPQEGEGTAQSPINYVLWDITKNRILASFCFD
jgi:hypothetical protein